MGRSHLVSSPKATSTRMKSILALVLLGVAIIHLGGATEEETDTQVAQQENQLDLLQIQELAEPDPRKKCGKNGKKCRNLGKKKKKSVNKKKKSGKNRPRKAGKSKRRSRKGKKTKKGKKRTSKKKKKKGKKTPPKKKKKKKKKK